MFPGYDLGETTQRIADGVFKVIKNYQYGIQFTSFYMPGDFMPHVRMMKEGYSSVIDQKSAGKAVLAALKFLSGRGVVKYNGPKAADTRVVEGQPLTYADTAGFKLV